MAYNIKTKKPTENIQKEDSFVLKNQRLAKTLMQIDSKIWAKHGWKSGSDVDSNVYQAELKQELDKKGIKEISYLQYHILEDANYHTLNQTLEELKVFKKGESYSSSEEKFKEYSDKGGKTWDI